MGDSLIDSLLGRVQGSSAQAIASQLGTDSGTASQAISAALPMLLGAMGRNAQQPGGAEALLRALQRDHSGPGAVDIGGMLGSVLGGGQGGAAGALGSLLGSVLGGGAPVSRQTDASGILEHVLGANRQQAESALSQKTGLSPAQSGKLLMMLAPVVMAMLAGRVRSASMGAAALSSLLGHAHASVQQRGGMAGEVLGAVLGSGGGAGGLGPMLGKIGANLRRGGR